MAIYNTYSSEAKIGATPASTLVSSTGDAQSNIFDVLIRFPWQEDAGAEGSYRSDGFKPPAIKTPTYEVTWHGIKVKRIAAGVNMNRELELNFRVDGNYAFYRKLTMWQAYGHDVNTGAVANQRVGGSSGLSNEGKIVVIAPGSEYNPSMFTDQYFKPGESDGSNQLLDAGGFKGNLIAWQFDQVMMTELGQPQFKNEADGKAITVKAKFIFGDSLYPFYTDPSNPN